MERWGSERSWDNLAVTEQSGQLCLGFLCKSEYVPFWIAVATVTLAVIAFNKVKEAKKAKKGTASAGQRGWRSMLRLRGRKTGGGLEEGLLAGEVERTPLRVASAQMAAACAEAGAARGLEAASLAVLLTLQHRRRYGTVSAAVLVGGKPQPVDVEPALGTSFRELLLAADAALRAPAPAEATAEAPEVVFAWGCEAPPGQWSVSQEGPSHISVRGSSLEEENSFRLLFEACAQNPGGDVWAEPVVPAGSLETVRTWGAAVLDLAAYRDPSSGKLRSVPEVVAALQASQEADAIVGDGFRISSAELRRRAAAVARVAVQRTGRGRKKAVGIYMGRGEAIGPSFLGVLSAGYTVVPVDVHWPSDRVRQVMEDGEVALVLTDPVSMEAWLAMEMKAPEAVLVDSAFFEANGNGIALDFPAGIPDQDDAAVVLFTSGSTGRPKGIVLSHGYLTALIVGVAVSKRMTKETRTLCYHSPTWMPFLDYLFAPMFVGGCCLYFPENETHVVKPNELKTFAQRHGATNAGFVPAMLDILLEQGLPKSLSDIGVGGAAVPAELCQRVVGLLPKAPDGSPGILYTGYSGTEQGDITQIRMRNAEDVDGGTADKGYMGAGRPHGAQHCAVLDLGFRPVGPEGIGEITCAGPGLATGYLKLPEKTAETFLPSLDSMGGRAARSGDLGKWTANGNLKVVGRRDSMVKVRGARIELGEVEAAVCSHPDVKATVVTVYEDKLVAYVVPAVPATLRDHCKARMVAYMVPHIFEGLEEVPRLANGKVNKKALPTPEERSDGVETVMELDSLGQMRKFTRRAASEDRVLDNVRAILIGVVIQSHATPLVLTGGLGMLDVAQRALPANWGPIQYLLLAITRGGGWSSLAFLNGFDDTRSMRPYGLTYREPLFLVLWVLLGFNWTMWYLPVFVYMRATFCAMHWLGLERTHLVLASQLWLLVPAVVDFYIGWLPSGPSIQGPCPSHCVCPWEEFPGAQTVSYFLSGWWVAPGDPTGHSFVGHALIFIPCYWIGFYTGGPIFKVLTRIADEANWCKRLMCAAGVLAIYCFMYSFGQPLVQGFDDRCSAFWGEEGQFQLVRIARNIVYYAMNLSMSLTYVVFIAAVVPVHLKYLAKNCFPALIMSAYTPCLLDLSSMALELRKVLPSAISPGVEMAWVFSIPFLYELVIGAIFATVVPPLARGIMAVVRRVKGE
mmetsp:Transcript_75549/g.213722  ORF Transcript_75549/g.213722 Transcript_75549/m.213722 type:complete len:1192 (+) Transcript_75549:47-3622(+)